MSEAKAHLKNYRQSPRKVRIVADLVRGKSVEEAQALLAFVPKRAALPIEKLLNSALANAESKENLIVKEIRVDAGATLSRRGHLSYRGGWGRVKKRTSQVSVVLAESKAKSKKAKPVVKKAKS